jgi:hypothetical protein
MTSFETRMRDLASRSGLRVKSLSSTRATLAFQCARSSQTLYVYEFAEGIWEFSCVSAIHFSRTSDFPQPVLATVLVANSKNKVGFWCVELLGGDYVLEYMHNIPGDLLNPEEFRKTCSHVVGQVDDLERSIFD